ncbi:hypothetical protein B0T26DRAFT_696513 [Lasiosphaeria miniovina]|uniref:Uncharacterized protein n=1 Tax=Lasiosphaeria miniovina TaxID=1954250 RepID=A0AA40E7K8_9PEZI|nr:uncharacterized protein B0T26DRAFT_696513 [Lasiosphaeria miniovina]KAK0728017.1 hypothetical protein B0T26DRAFT_696513 [Lasiosphaeria miniovina]
MCLHLGNPGRESKSKSRLQGRAFIGHNPGSMVETRMVKDTEGRLTVPKASILSTNSVLTTCWRNLSVAFCRCSRLGPFQG